MNVSGTTRTLLAFRSGDLCAFPGCGTQLTADAPTGDVVSIIGEAAHIAGEKPGAARHDTAMGDVARNHCKNLIYLCPTHHTQIDKQAAAFPVPLLKRFKSDHESKVRAALKEAFAEIGFAELRVATDWACRCQATGSTEDYAVLPPEAKIEKNRLTNESRFVITMGLSVARLVGQFVQEEALIDEDYPRRLTAGFLEEYFRLIRLGLKGDELFDMMCSFAQRGVQGQAKRSAGVAVLVYLFEKCDVFEK